MTAIAAQMQLMTIREGLQWVERAQWGNLAGSNSGALSTEVLKTLGTRRCLNIYSDELDPKCLIGLPLGDLGGLRSGIF